MGKKNPRNNAKEIECDSEEAETANREVAKLNVIQIQIKLRVKSSKSEEIG
ncbi:hypothetical protein MKX03_021004 [Papaver bracteatum]|nr:hypothetical protein MKX03_021004 [Papaver bracteatum]